jgi:hypothetical protein
MTDDDSFVRGTMMMMHDVLVDDALVGGTVMGVGVSQRGHSHQGSNSCSNERKFHD